MPILTTRSPFKLSLTAVLLCSSLVCPRALADLDISLIAYSDTSAWQSVFAGFDVQESFEDTTLADGLSVTVAGQAFSVPETHTSLPALFNPHAKGIDNTAWDGAHAVTNYAYSSGGSDGNHWTNNWDFSSATKLAQSLTFTIGEGGAESFGVGLSDFQSPGWPSARTNHELLVNGVSQGNVESLPGSFTGGTQVRNGYLVITADPGEPITSVEIRNLTDTDGLVFDALGYSVASVPEPLSTITWSAMASFLAVAKMRRRRRPV